MNKTIFVGGIHGVGKTSLCKSISTIVKIPHYSASGLIAKVQNKEFSNDKRIKKIEENQDLLTLALKNLQLENEYLILDGHFCLLNNVGEVEKIPEKTFKNISPIAIIVVTDSVESISERLTRRDNINYDSQFLEVFQNQELEHSKLIANNLNIPYLIHSNANSYEELVAFLKKLLNE